MSLVLTAKIIKKAAPSAGVTYEVNRTLSTPGCASVKITDAVQLLRLGAALVQAVIDANKSQATADLVAEAARLVHGLPPVLYTANTTGTGQVYVPSAPDVRTYFWPGVLDDDGGL